MSKQPTITPDAAAFLETLLWLANDTDAGERPLSSLTIYDFAPAFIAGCKAFCEAFRTHAEALGYDLAALERSFGGNVYLSLSGHGAGFFDEADAHLAELHSVLQTWAGGRFEQLESELDVNDAGKIDLAYIPEAINARRAALFAVPTK